MDFEQQLIVYFHWSYDEVENASYFELQEILNASRNKEDETITGEDLKERGGFASIFQ
ncbi:hypothetical protein N6G94_10180 (plasmid) [Pediococcus inopinatus]|uniref:hypothetical protein n=1 Tax=Pediococcus TaxID=1253 RepID=UPI00116F4963|nr:MULTISPECIES: hypothetical protein [Pediococcus]WPC18524.1 hypothetical protein N6G94_10180 [Pediococcus inopinatus]GEA92768.1 hypothetical protein PDA01_06610 [Pediococcus damnosus]